MTHTYADRSCPREDITQFADAGMCYDTLSSSVDYGVYTGGYYLNGTKLLLTKDQANDAVSWQCTGAFWKMVFNNQWYCFLTYGIGQGDGKYSMIADNYCGTQTSGSSSVVVNDGRLFLWLYHYYPWAPMYIGLILDNTTNAFKWYDNTLQNVPWAAGCPNNTSGNKTLAIVDSSGNVCDEDPLQMTAFY
ncbi:hypothetical protein AAVH_22426 [Aphelenchoides avenae]|nr:hypothetical protein AAVH_22426 [Aphelenchus avenae]